MFAKFKKLFNTIKQIANIILLIMSPMAVFMLIVAFLVGLEQGGLHRELRQELTAQKLTAPATITNCYPDSGYCFAEFIDHQGNERYGTLEWRYYDDVTKAEIMAFDSGKQIEVHYATPLYENSLVLSDQFDVFYAYKGHYYNAARIIIISWAILMLHPEVLLFALVPDIEKKIGQKWQRMIAELR
jgi:hypothetical protein